MRKKRNFKNDLVYDNQILDFSICVRTRLRVSENYKPDIYYVLKTGGDEFYCEDLWKTIYQLISLLRCIAKLSYRQLVKSGYVRRFIDGKLHYYYRNTINIWTGERR